MNNRILLLSFLFTFGLSSVAMAQCDCVYTSTGDGDWDDASTWNAVAGPGGGGCDGDYPGENRDNDCVIIASDDAVTLSGLTLTLGEVNLISRADWNITGGAEVIVGPAPSGGVALNLENQADIQLSGSSTLLIDGNVAAANNGNIDVLGGSDNNFGVLGCLPANRRGILSDGDLTWCIDASPATGCDTSEDSDGGTPDNTACDLLGPLPVSMVYFSYNLSANSVELVWGTVSEEYNDYFQIEKSADGVAFEPIGTVKGMGTTQQAQDYSFTDYELFPGLNYYRLKQVDYDGKASYSDVIGFRVGDEDRPAKVWAQNHTLSVDLPALDQASIQVYNVMGKLVHAKTVSTKAVNTLMTMDLSSQASGIYIIHVVSTEGVIQTEKVLLK